MNIWALAALFALALGIGITTTRLSKRSRPIKGSTLGTFYLLARTFGVQIVLLLAGAWILSSSGRREWAVALLAFWLVGVTGVFGVGALVIWRRRAANRRT